ncbi:hypothetical protein [Paracoccus alkanivorans]|nr:hypothetical protein [Paracoccus alkanivorans]
MSIQRSSEHAATMLPDGEAMPLLNDGETKFSWHFDIMDATPPAHAQERNLIFRTQSLSNPDHRPQGTL